jgi:hypothetical protein
MPDLSREDAFLAVIDNVKLSGTIKIIKTSELWCSNRSSDQTHPCSCGVGGELLMIDGSHLSVRGATLFARNMLHHPQLVELCVKH